MRSELPVSPSNASAAAPMIAALRRSIRLPGMIALLIIGLSITLLAFPFQTRDTRRRLITWWSGLLLKVCGIAIDVRRDPAAPDWTSLGRERGFLLLSNHVSWLDIFVINRCSAARFVAKAEIRSWPLIGTLVARVGTLFIERGRRRAVHHMLHEVAGHLQAPDLVAVFPEGTTSDGYRLLPFHGNLIQAAISTGTPLLPVGIRYCEPDPDDANRAGEPSDITQFIGATTFVASAWRILGHPRLVARLDVLAPIVPPADAQRHELAEVVRTRISLATGLVLEDTIPEVLRGIRA